MAPAVSIGGVKVATPGEGEGTEGETVTVDGVGASTVSETEEDCAFWRSFMT